MIYKYNNKIYNRVKKTMCKSKEGFMRLKDNKIIILLIFLTSSILIFGFNYLYGNNRKPSPYFMSDKLIAFESNNNNHSLDFLNMNENISVVAEIKTPKMLRYMIQ